MTTKANLPVHVFRSKDVLCILLLDFFMPRKLNPWWIYWQCDLSKGPIEYGSTKKCPGLVALENKLFFQDKDNISTQSTQNISAWKRAALAINSASGNISAPHARRSGQHQTRGSTGSLTTEQTCNQNQPPDSQVTWQNPYPNPTEAAKKC